MKPHESSRFNKNSIRGDSWPMWNRGIKAPVTHSRFWLRLITIRPDETYIVKSGCIGMVKTENSEIPTMSHDVPTVSLRLFYDS